MTINEVLTQFASSREKSILKMNGSKLECVKIKDLSFLEKIFLSLGAVFGFGNSYFPNVVKLVNSAEVNDVALKFFDEKIQHYKAQHAFKGRDIQPYKFFGSTFEIVDVLDQRRVPGGQVACGLHAIKNAYGIIYNLSLTNSENFTSIADRLKLNLNSLSDLTLANLIEFAKTLEIGKMVSIFNPTLGVLGAGLDQTSLDQLASLKHLNKLQFLRVNFKHTFILGSEGHWVVLRLEQDKLGNRKWFGYDSWKASGADFKSYISLLEQTIDNPDKAFKEGYEHAVGEGNRRRSKREFTSDLIYRVCYCYDFMKTVGWLDSKDPVILEHRKNLKSLVDKIPPYSMTNQFHEMKSIL